MNIIPTNAKLVQGSSDFEDDCLETPWEKLKTEDDDKNNTKERMQQHNNSTRRQNNTKPDQKVLHGYTTAAAAALASGSDRCRTEDAGINLKEFQVKHTCAASDCSGPSFDGVMKNM
jgi:activator of HSP90 ATPase